MSTEPNTESPESNENQNSVTSSSVAEKAEEEQAQIEAEFAQGLVRMTSQQLVDMFRKGEHPLFLKEFDMMINAVKRDARLEEKDVGEQREKQLRDAMSGLESDLNEVAEQFVAGLQTASEKARAVLSSVAPTTTPTNERRVDGYWMVQDENGTLFVDTVELYEELAQNHATRNDRAVPVSFLIHEPPKD